MKKIKFKYLNIKRNKIKDFALRTLSALSITLLINGVPKTVENENIMEDNATGIFYSADDSILNCGIHDGEAEIEQYVNDNIDTLNIEKLEIINNQLITDLSCFRSCYDQIKTLEISNCSSLLDLSEIFKMNNLKAVYIYECPGITRDFVLRISEKGITHNITEQDIANSEKIDSITKEIINDQMSEREKIKAIVDYITDNYSYDLDYIRESNKRPMSCFFENSKGVCSSYAYLANVLFRKDGIESYELTGSHHAWNVVKLDDKFYYIDVTCLDDDFEKFLLNNFDISSYFLTNPSENGHTSMEDYNAGKEKIFISQDLRKKIARGEELKNFFEKYPYLSFFYGADFVISMLCFGISYMFIETLKMKLEDKKQSEQFDLDVYQKKYNAIKLKKKTLK